MFAKGLRALQQSSLSFQPCQIAPEGAVWGTSSEYEGVWGEENGTAAIPTAGCGQAQLSRL